MRKKSDSSRITPRLILELFMANKRMRIRSADTVFSHQMWLISFKVVGTGSFGVVYKAKLSSTGECIAIKKVLQNKRYKNRELQVMRMLTHKNVILLKFFFFSSGEKKDQLYLNLILEYVLFNSVFMQVSLFWCMKDHRV